MLIVLGVLKNIAIDTYDDNGFFFEQNGSMIFLLVLMQHSP